MSRRQTEFANAPHASAAMERHQKQAARVLCAVMAALAALACIFLVTGYGKGSIATASGTSAVSPASADDPFYVLLIGSDSRKGTALYTGVPGEHTQIDQHADALTLMRVDPQGYLITLVTVPPNTVLTGETRPLSYTLMDNDPQNTVNAVEQLTGVSISYYMLTGFSGFEGIVDQLGSVTVDVDVTVKGQDPLTAKNVVVKSGDNRKLLASGALAFARAWGEYPSDNAVHRQANIRALEVAIIKKVLGMDEGTALAAASTLGASVFTNMGTTLMNNLVAKFADQGAGQVTVYQCTGPDTVTDKAKGYVAQDAVAWDQLMYVVDRGYDPARSYESVQAEEEQKAAAEEAAQQNAGQYTYQNDTWYGTRQESSVAHGQYSQQQSTGGN